MSRTVLVVNSDVPFVQGGHRVIAEELVRALTRAGHRAELVRTPSNRFGKTLEAYLATWLTDVGETGYGAPVDHVISLRYPAYAVRHPRHAAWVVHRMREYYDLWEPLAASLGRSGLLKESIRRYLIHAIDRHLLGTVRDLYCISDTVRERLLRWGGHTATTLHPPPPVRPYRTEAYEPFVLGVSRLHRWKRMHLLVEAAALKPSLRIVVAGDGPEREALAHRASALALGGRARFLGAVSDEQLLELYARARAVFFAPYSEDYGFVSVESFMAAKPVVTCHDSGGARELVRDGENGFVVAPEPAVIAATLERLMDDPPLAEKLGASGRQLAGQMSWEGTVRTLLGGEA